MADAKLKFSLEVDDKGSVKLKKFGKTVDETALKGGNFGAKMKAAAAGVGSLALGAAKAATALATVGAAMAVGIGTKSVAAFAEYEEAVSRLSVVTSESLESVKKKISQIGPEFGNQTELIKGYYDVLSAGAGKYGDEIEFLKTASMMAKQAHIEQGNAVKGLATVMAAYGKEIGTVSAAANLLYNIEANGLITVKEMIPYMGELSNLAKTSGLSYQEMAAGYAQMSKEGAGASAAMTKFKAVVMGLQGSFDKLPKSIKDFGTATAAIKALGFEGVLKEIAKATDLNVGSLKTMLGTQEAALGVIQLAKGGWSEYGTALDGVKTKTDTFTKAWEGFKETLNGVWGTFKNIVQNFMISIGEQLAPTVKELVKVFGEWMEAIKPDVIEWLKKAMEGLPEKISSMRTEIMGAVEWFKNFIPVIETVLTVITGLAKGFLWLGDMIAQAMVKVAEFFDYFDRHPPVDVLVNFMGQGSSEAPLGEKIQEMQDKLEVFARVANFHARGTVEFVGEGGKPLGEALDYMTKKLETLPLLAEETGKEFEKAATGAEKVAKAYGGVKDAANDAAPAVDGIGQAVAETTDRFLGQVLVGQELAYTMKSVRHEFSATGIKLNEHAADMRQLRDEYIMWADAANRSAAAMQLSTIYWRAAQSAAESYRNELAKLTRAERDRARWGGFDSAADMQRGTSRDFAGEMRANMRSYATGTGMGGLPYTGYFRGHQGEIVLNSNESKLFRSVAQKTRSETGSAAASSGGGNNISVTISPQVMIGDRSGIRAVMPYLKEELDTYLRRTKTGWAA